MIRRIILVLALTCVLIAAVGCNTVEGMGRDISDLGHAISEAAN